MSDTIVKNVLTFGVVVIGLLTIGREIPIDVGLAVLLTLICVAVADYAQWKSQ